MASRGSSSSDADAPQRASRAPFETRGAVQRSTRVQAVLLKELFNRLESDGIGYVVLRNYESLPQACGKDLDVLIQPREARRLVELMVEICSA